MVFALHVPPKIPLPPQSLSPWSTHSQQSVDEAGFLLAIPPDAGHGLVVVGRVPVGVEHDQSVGADQVQAAAARLAAQHEDELRGGGVVEPLHDLGDTERGEGGHMRE